MIDPRTVRFDALCKEWLALSAVRDSDGIGTYNEKILHKLLKRTVTDDETCLEVKVGTYVADVREAGRITEIQTGSLYPLAPKLAYFLGATDDAITVVHPIVEALTILRIDPETGELLRRVRSPKKGRARDILPELWYLRDLFPNERLTLVIPLLRAEEYRYSERMRYRTKGAYDAHLLPLGVNAWTELRDLADVDALLPDALRAMEGFTAEQFGRAMGLPKGRRRTIALQFLYSKGLCTREKKGRGYWYHLISPIESE